MIDYKYLGHNFQNCDQEKINKLMNLHIDSFYWRWYFCINCNEYIVYGGQNYNQLRYLIYINDIGWREPLTCKEYIIKNIIE